MAMEPDSFEPLTGGCLCGAVRYRIERAPIDAGFCHCRQCQRSSGAPVLAWLTLHAPDFVYIRGAPAVYRSSMHGHREFCPACGAQLVFRNDADAATADVTLASLDDPARVAPQYHIWMGSNIAWFDLADSLPRFDDAGPDTL